MALRPDLDADLETERRETRKLCSKVGVADAEGASSSVEFERRLITLADCLRLSVELVFSFVSFPRAPRRLVWATTGEELATMVDSVGDPVGAELSVTGALVDGRGGVEAK